MTPPFQGQGTTITQPPNLNQQRQMSGPPQAMGPGNAQQQQGMPQMGGPNPYGGYPGQQQQHQRHPGMNMQGGPGGGGNPGGGFMHQAPNQGHRNSGMPPPMNMGHQYNPNQGGYNPNQFNQQGMQQQQQQQQMQPQQQQYGHPQQQQQQQHGYPQQHNMQQQHGGMPGQQQNLQQQMQQQQQHPMQRQNTGNYGHPQQQQQQQQQQNNMQQQQNVQQQQQQMPPQQQQQYGQPQQNAYNRGLSSSTGPSPALPLDVGQSSTGVGANGPLNFNNAPGNNNAMSAGTPSPAPPGMMNAVPGVGVGVGGNNPPGGGGPGGQVGPPGVVGGPGGGPGGPPGQGGDYGQQFLPSGLNGDWQSDNDMHHRREMIQHIVKLLKQKDKNASPEWLTKLPQMVKQLEVSLYRSAPSFEAYSDTSTLKTRLQQLAMEIAKKTQQAKEGPGDVPSTSTSSRGSGGQSSSRRNGSTGNNNGNPQGMGNNPMLGGNFNMTSTGSNNQGNDPSGSGNEVISSQHGNPNDPEWKVRIRHKQQRLLLLHHSSKCQYEDGKCKVTPYCGEMKKLWKHMARCTDNECRVPHCFSSRSILSHYRKCKDPRCPACGPVRETVRKTQRTQRSGRGGGGNQNQQMNPQQQQGGLQMPGDNSGGIGIAGGSNNYGMPQDPMGGGGGGGMQNTAGNMGIMQQQQQQQQGNNSNASNSNNPMGGGMMPQIGNMGAPQMANGGMPNMMQQGNNSNGMGGGNNNNGAMGQQQQMNSGAPIDGMMNGMNNNGPNGMQQQPQPQQQPTAMNSMFPNSGQQNQNNNMPMGPPQQPQQPQNQPPQPPPQQQPGGGNPPNNNSNQNDSSQQQMMPPPNNSSNANNNNDAAASTNANSNDASGGRNRPEPDAKARHKRQRLLLLRHASKCTAENGQCTTTPHCAEMKVLWKHIANCKDSYCKVRHCMSSRYVLSHYRRCKPPCNICDPVKEIIKNGFNNHIEVDPAIMEGGSSGGGGAPAAPTTGVRNTPPIDNSSQQPQTKRRKVEEETVSSSAGMVASMPPQQQPPQAPTSAPSSAPPQSQSSMDKVTSEQAPVPPVSAPSPPAPSSTAAPPTKPKSPKPKSNPTEDHALLECFTTEQVKTHIQSLKKFAKLAPNELKGKCLEILKGLQAHEHGWVFATPVNPVELGLDDYFEIIKKPMDLGTIQKKGEAGSYHSFEDFRSDVRLTFENAMKYNEERTVVHEMAKELKKKFDTDFKKLMKELDKEHAECSKKVQACGLCGCEKLNFEAPVFFCNGLNCPTKRIRRNTHFYVTADKQYAWCNQCFGDLKGETIDCGTTKVKKADLTKRKNDEVHEESWVQCDDCERWIHQICGLYNTRQDKENTSAYSCPLCLLDKRKKEPEPAPLPEAPSANDIPRTKLSDWLEKDVHTRVDNRMKELAAEKADTENISFEEAYKTLSAGGPLTIRQVTSTDRKHEVRELMKARYAHKNYPEEFPYRCKCIVVFQNIGGVDVVLFALYVYEHGEDNPIPNKRTVYVSYLDSVHFMQPRKMRTFIYHEILISYLDYARDKGYEQAFIWACPPLKGDDYIFYAKPEDQKTPKDVRLRQWYLDMLEDCQRRDIVGKVTNMYDHYFDDKSLDAAAVPYFEGDYFPGEAENIIKDLNDEGKKGSGGGKKKSSSKSKKSGDAINGASSGSEKSYKEGGLDPVMQKFCDAISGMKESFIVAFLNSKNAKPENLVVPKAITEYRQSNKLLENGKGAAPDQSNSSSSTKQVDRFGRPIRVLDDDIEEIDCEFFNTRQCFLDLCRGNHYQFDELRRAKHTSMMVLWHLQNREAPKFVQQCFACAREISSGVRHHCSVCPDFDLCNDCFRDPKANRGQCTHTLEKIKVEKDTSSTSGLTEEQRKERQRNIQLHIALIEHASRCTSTKCTSSNCQKMKSYLKHGQVCKVKAGGGCKVCKRIWTLLRIHAQQCKSSSCPIPQCIAIRKRIRQLQLKQRAMDDRRRQEMNRHYRSGTMSS